MDEQVGKKHVLNNIAVEHAENPRNLGNTHYYRLYCINKYTGYKEGSFLCNRCTYFAYIMQLFP
jgi:hypothetical protein